jgi:hypothetical protein
MPATCNKRVGTGTVTYGCIVQIPDGMGGHEGPCASRENSRSLAARKQWETEQAAAKEARSTLAATQGPPQTFHEAMGDSGGTPVPGSGLQPKEHREQHQPRVGEEGEVYREPDATQAAADTLDASQEPEEPRTPRGRVTDSLAQHVGVGQPFAPDTAIAKGEPTKQREGDQRLPVDGFGPLSHRAVQEDLEARLNVGVGRYGKALQAGNGRNSLQDLYEEILDASVYLKTLEVEREHFATMLRDVLANGEPSDLVEVAADVASWLEQ